MTQTGITQIHDSRKHQSSRKCNRQEDSWQCLERNPGQVAPQSLETSEHSSLCNSISPKETAGVSERTLEQCLNRKAQPRLFAQVQVGVSIHERHEEETHLRNATDFTVC